MLRNSHSAEGEILQPQDDVRGQFRLDRGRGSVVSNAGAEAESLAEVVEIYSGSVNNAGRLRKDS